MAIKLPGWVNSALAWGKDQLKQVGERILDPDALSEEDKREYMEMAGGDPVRYENILKLHRATFAVAMGTTRGVKGVKDLTSKGKNFNQAFSAAKQGLSKATLNAIRKQTVGIVKRELAKAPAALKASPMFGKTAKAILATGGLITGIGLVITNTLDFYNWNGPIQKILKNKFPGLFPQGTAPKAEKHRQITPAEARQMQSVIFQETGLMLEGEDLRQALSEIFGTVYTEYAPKPGEVPGPLSVDDAGSFTKAVKASTRKTIIRLNPAEFAQPQGGGGMGGVLKLTERGTNMIENESDLQLAAMNALAPYLQTLPQKLTYEVKTKRSWKDADGIVHTGNFAVMVVKIEDKTPPPAILTELLLGEMGKGQQAAGQLKAPAVERFVAEQVLSASSSLLPELPGTPPPLTEAGTGIRAEALPLPTTTGYVGTGAIPPAPPSSTKPTMPLDLFKENEPYKYADNPTVYVYQQGLLRGAVSADAFARHYGAEYRAGMDLNLIHKISPMPDLSPFYVPPYFFQGAYIT